MLAPQAGPNAHKSGSGPYLETGAETHPTELDLPAALSSKEEAGSERRRAGHLPLPAGSEGRAPTTAPPQGLWGSRPHKEGRGEERRRGGGPVRRGARELGSSPPWRGGPPGAGRAPAPQVPLPSPPGTAPPSPAQNARSFPDPEARGQAHWRLSWTGPGRSRGAERASESERGPLTCSLKGEEKEARGFANLGLPRGEQVPEQPRAVPTTDLSPGRGDTSPLVNTGIDLIYTAYSPSPPRAGGPWGLRPPPALHAQGEGPRRLRQRFPPCSRDFQGRKMAQTWFSSTVRRSGQSSEGLSRLCGARRAWGLLAVPPPRALGRAVGGCAGAFCCPGAGIPPVARRRAHPDRALASCARGRFPRPHAATAHSRLVETPPPPRPVPPPPPHTPSQPVPGRDG